MGIRALVTVRQQRKCISMWFHQPGLLAVKAFVLTPLVQKGRMPACNDTNTVRQDYHRKRDKISGEKKPQWKKYSNLWFHENNLLKLKYSVPCLQGGKGCLAELAFCSLKALGVNTTHCCCWDNDVISFSFSLVSIPKVEIINIDHFRICLHCKNKQKKSSTSRHA